MADPDSGDGALPKRSRREDLRLVRRYWPFVAPERRWLALGLLAVPVMTVGGLAQPYLIKEAIDGPIAAELRGSTYGGPWTIGTLALVFLLAVMAEYGFRGLQLYALQHAGYASLTRLRRAVFAHVLGQSGKFFDQRATGTLLSRTTNDVEALGEVLTFGIVGIVGDIVDIVAIFAAMVILDVRLTAMSLVVAPIIVIVVNYFRRQLRKHSTEIRRSMAEASGAFQEALAGAKVVQLHGRREATVQEYKALNYRYFRAYKLSNWYDASLYAVMDGVASLSIALVIWYGGGAALQGAVSVGLLVAFIQYIQRVFVPIRELSGKVATIERALAALERVFGLLDVDERLPQGDHAPAKVAGRLEFDGVQFSYDGKTPILRDVRLQVAPGHMLALVGPTGSGKTTLARLLTRQYAAGDDSVRLDGTPVERWQLQTLRRAVGVVQQDVVLFSGTLGDNVDLGRGLDRQTLETALRDACLGDLLDRLGGLDAVLGEGGGGLSAGERQLLSIARVLAANPAVVVLDEATASIDTLTEQKVQAAIERVLAGRTALVVAHRLSTVRRADQIAVLRQGEVVECGDHQTLVDLGGLYAELVAAGERQGAIA